MKLHKTGHPIADTVSDLIGELPDGNYAAAYGILRHNVFDREHWFEIDKGLWGANHYDGNYRLSYRGTQPRYSPDGPHEPHGLELIPWHDSGDKVLICPPTAHVSEFFHINFTDWLMQAIRQADKPYIIRNKGAAEPIKWHEINTVITFNSTIGYEALRRGIKVISDPNHSTIGSYTRHIKSFTCYDRNPLLSFSQGHQFLLSNKDKICKLINHYQSRFS